MIEHLVICCAKHTTNLERRRIILVVWQCVSNESWTSASGHVSHDDLHVLRFDAKPPQAESYAFSHDVTTAQANQDLKVQIGVYLT